MKKYRFNGVHNDPESAQAQVNWGGHADPRGLLEVGKAYEVYRIEVHTWHTKVFLVGFPGKSFNSVWFTEVEA